MIFGETKVESKGFGFYVGYYIFKLGVNDIEIWVEVSIDVRRIEICFLCVIFF